MVVIGEDSINTNIQIWQSQTLFPLISGLRLVPEPGHLHPAERPHEAEHRLRRPAGRAQVGRAQDAPGGRRR